MKAKLFLVKPPVKTAQPADEFAVGPDQQTAYDDPRAALLEDLVPQGALHMEYFERLVHASWILERCRILEAGILARGLDAFRDDAGAKTLDYLHRRAAAAERVYSRALQGLLARNR